MRKDIKLNFWRGFADCIEKEGIKTWGGGGDGGFIISGFILKKNYQRLPWLPYFKKTVMESKKY